MLEIHKASNLGPRQRDQMYQFINEGFPMLTEINEDERVISTFYNVLVKAPSCLETARQILWSLTSLIKGSKKHASIALNVGFGPLLVSTMASTDEGTLCGGLQALGNICTISELP